MTEEKLYTRLETSKALGISLYSLMKLTREGVIPVVRKGYKKFYTQEVIDKFKKDNNEEKRAD